MPLDRRTHRHLAVLPDEPVEPTARPERPAPQPLETGTVARLGVWSAALLTFLLAWAGAVRHDARPEPAPRTIRVEVPVARNDGNDTVTRGERVARTRPAPPPSSRRPARRSRAS